MSSTKGSKVEQGENLDSGEKQGKSLCTWARMGYSRVPHRCAELSREGIADKCSEYKWLTSYSPSIANVVG